MSVRLPITLILYIHRKVKFTELENFLHLSAGNLNFHLRKLSDLNYVKIRKSFLTGRLQTIIEITEHGEGRFKEYIEEIKHVLKQVKLNIYRNCNKNYQCILLLRGSAFILDL